MVCMSGITGPWCTDIGRDRACFMSMKVYKCPQESPCLSQSGLDDDHGSQASHSQTLGQGRSCSEGAARCSEDKRVSKSGSRGHRSRSGPLSSYKVRHRGSKVPRRGGAQERQQGTIRGGKVRRWGGRD